MNIEAKTRKLFDFEEISQLGTENLSSEEQKLFNDVMVNEKFIARYLFDYETSQTVLFVGKKIDPKTNQVDIDTRIVLDGFQHFSPRQPVTGNTLVGLKGFNLF